MASNHQDPITVQRRGSSHRFLLKSFERRSDRCANSIAQGVTDKHIWKEERL